MIEAKEYILDENLTPHVTHESLVIHYEQHYLKYIEKCNKLIKDTIYEDKSLEHIIQNSGGPIFENASQIYNHEFYFGNLTSKKTEPQELTKLIEDEWGTHQPIKTMQTEFTKQAMKVVGCGWIWLVWDFYSNALKIITLPNAMCPIAEMHSESLDAPYPKYIPIIACDLWEHAYYKNHLSDRKTFLESFWDVVDWDIANKRTEEIL